MTTQETGQVHPTALVDDKAELGSNVTIGAFCSIGADVKIGDNCVIHQSVVIDGITRLGKDNAVFPFAVLGTTPQHLGFKGEASVLEIGDGNIIREYVTMHPGTKIGGMKTQIGTQGMFMIGCHIAHDCHIGDHVIMANHVMMGGHVRIEDHVMIGGMTAIQQYARIGAYSMVGGASAVTKDVPPFAKAFGNHCYIGGVNVIGLERNGFSKERRQQMRAIYRDLFCEGVEFGARLANVRTKYGADADAQLILKFIDAQSALPIMQMSHHRGSK